jgi:hypothetical protein
MDTAVLNKGLDLAMEFGANWLRPIQDRLAVQFPQLSEAELNEYDRVCREAMNFGHTQLVSCWQEAHSEQHQAFEFFRRDVVARYPWVSSTNLSHLFSQGCYYAFKDGDI